MNRHSTVRLTRREALQAGGAFAAGALLERFRAATHGYAQQPTTSPAERTVAFRAQIGATPIQTEKLADNLILLSGPGGNVVVLTGPDGMLLVDTFVSPAWPKLQEALRGLGTAPVRHVINTHWHFDHTDNNAPLHALGATVLAHANTKTRMSQPHHLAILDLQFPPSPAVALPQQVFKDSQGLQVNGESLKLSHVAPAHTDTDIYVHFEKANVLHTGDVFFNGRYPYIDGSTGGRMSGMVAGATTLLGLADDHTKIVPGHGARCTKADLARYRDMMATAHDRVSKLKSSGKSLEEAIAAKPFTDLDDKWGKGRFDGDAFVRIVYSTL
ncbi:MAG: MBL fold metallo-hydrolase [Gemmatimonadetes bacterium]|nr:MAG: MBL fold metallo-hydrolase [Gemmatimonadota bacterium]